MNLNLLGWSKGIYRIHFFNGSVSESTILRNRNQTKHKHVLKFVKFM
jgi:hypothetical protein